MNHPNPSLPPGHLAALVASWASVLLSIAADDEVSLRRSSNVSAEVEELVREHRRALVATVIDGFADAFASLAPAPPRRAPRTKPTSPEAVAPSSPLPDPLPPEV